MQPAVTGTGGPRRSCVCLPAREAPAAQQPTAPGPAPILYTISNPTTTQPKTGFFFTQHLNKPMDLHEPRPARRVQLQQQQQARSRLKHQKLRASFIGYTIVLVFLALLQCIGIYLFTKGFLLSRQVLPDIARCSPDTCFATPKFDRAVVLVVDALRFDFAVPVDPAHALHDEYCHNHFSVLYELAQKHPENAVLLKFLADPPTTTLQRLKGLTTGLLPTFIDAGLNFNGDAISEDNWVLQLHKHNRTLAFMGDDTWTALFDLYICPRLNFPYESLNVWDLHTVDDGVASHLFPLLPLHDWTSSRARFSFIPRPRTRISRLRNSPTTQQTWAQTTAPSIKSTWCRRSRFCSGCRSRTTTLGSLSMRCLAPT